ncbi:MAG TPA: mandelate racemase/muconate lactonizing enzyme family protein [Casimicrobiaceae bacterium]
MTQSLIEEVRWHTLQVTPKTIWSFIEVIDALGRIGTGEATLTGHESEMRALLDQYKHAAVAHTPAQVDLGAARNAARSLPQFAVISALDQAASDLAAQQQGICVSAMLGERRRDRVPVYANINRGIAERTPDGFAAHARRAVEDGFSVLKIAPFDGVELYGDNDKHVDGNLLDAGIARIAAVRDAIGPERDLMVDCHWRLNRSIAEAVLRATEPHRLYWLECPIPETPEMMVTLRELRSLANDRGVRLAGCEEISRVQGFMPFLDADVYDVMMPDVKYVGGMREMLDVARAMQRHGVGFSPHNPSGPICHAASLQICAVTPELERLEMQYAETPLFDALVHAMIPRPVNGEIAVSDDPGVGVQLDPAVMDRLRVD